MSGGRSLSRRDCLIGGGMLATAISAGAISHSLGQAQSFKKGFLGQLLPERAAGWARAPSDGVLIPRAEEGTDRIYDDVATAYYVSNSASAVMLLAAYGSAQAGTTQLHRPEVCYPSAGFRVASRRSVSVPIAGGVVPAILMSASATGREEQILYWSRVGDQFPTSNLQQRLSVLRETLAGRIPDGILLRLSVITGDEKAALPVLAGFAAALVAASDGQLRRLLVGPA